MKHKLLFSLLIVAILGAASCTDPNPPQPEVKYLSSFTGDLKDFTRAYVTLSSGKLAWEPKDSVAVMNGEECSIFVYDKKSNRFKTDKPLQYKNGFYAIYPASINNGIKNGGFNVTIPTEQKYSAKTVQRAPMWASSEDSVFHFKNLCAIIEFNVKADSLFSKLSFTSSEKAVSGNASIVNGEFVFDEGSSNLISVDIPSSITIQDSLPVYVTVPAQIYTGGFSLRADYTSGIYFAESTTETIALSGGVITSRDAFKKLQFSGGEGTIVNPWKIASSGDLVILSKYSVDASQNYNKEYYEQVCDIDFNGAELTAICSNNSFLGSYDGGGHKIKNIKIVNSEEKPLGFISTLGSTGLVKNLTLENVNITSGYSRVGGFVGNMTGGTIKNCSIDHNSIVCQTTKKAHYVGGIAGISSGAAVISNCHSEASVSGPCGNIGGIIGAITGTTSIENCTVSSRAIVEGGVEDESGCNIGGIVGIVNGAESYTASANVNSCSCSATLNTHFCDNGGIVGRLNKGTVSECLFDGIINCDFNDSAFSPSEGSELSHSNTGGIAGWISGICSIVSNCTSRATITATSRYVGGILGHISAGSVRDCNFEGGKISAVSYVGGIAGCFYNYGASSCKVLNSTITASDGMCGGITGYNYAAMISDCHFGEGSKILGGGTGKHKFGGLVGATYGNAAIVRECSISGEVSPSGGIVGGAVGYLDYGVVRNTILKKTAIISSTDYSIVGGLVGQVSSHGGFVMECSTESGAQVKCLNTGQHVGGMVGQLDNGEISGCTVNGVTISAANTGFYCGGIVGIVKGNATDGSKCVVKNCIVNGGKITGCETKGMCGGVVGYISTGAMINNCHSSMDLATGSPVAGIVGKITSDVTLVANCLYYDGKINGVGDYGGVAGVVGLLDASSASNKNTVVNCAAYPGEITYSKGSVSGITNNPEGSVINCYSPVDGGAEPTLTTLNGGSETYNGGTPLYDVKADAWVMSADGRPVQSQSPIATPDPGPKKIKVGLMGDSITTYSGWTPYPKTSGYPLAKWPDVTSVEQVYWHQLIYKKMTNCELDVNSAYSGSCVMETTYYHVPGRGFLVRYTDLKNPDIILINGGTNDCSKGLPMGVLNFDLPEDQLNVYTFAGAYDMLIRKLKQKFPSAKIGLICGDVPSRNTTCKQIILDIAAHYDLPCAVVVFPDLNTYTEDTVHPNAVGHTYMADTIWEQFKDKF